MSAPVDVLAVMDHAIVVLHSAQLGASAESINGVTVESVQAACARIAGRLEHVEAARAAVAELIEADKEYDAANRDWENARSADPEDISDETWRRVADRFEVAVMRRIAALTRVRGAS